MYLVLPLLLVVCCVAWPPVPPASPPKQGIDTPGSDFPDMPITLPSADYQLCANLCSQKVGCRAWAYGIPGCDQYQKPVCWLKFIDPHNDVPNKCRISGIANTHPCQMTTQWTNKVDPANTLPEYPRPQLDRSGNSWTNLNGLWEFQPGAQGQPPPFGQKLSNQILVPFPVEACLSGIGWTYEYLWYRLVFNRPSGSLSNFVLNFGAVDWQTTVYLNRQNIGNHTGGYDSFSFDITKYLQATGNELILFVYDPSDHGQQVFGKQRISAMVNPGGDTYTPSSGIWQTVWIENVAPTYITNIKITPTLSTITILINATNSNVPASITVKNGNTTVTTASGRTGTPLTISIPNPQLWSPKRPFLYELTITLQATGSDSVNSYFGLRTITLGKDADGVTRPLINGEFTFLAGWLDQSWWPDGQYTAPTDDALAFDLYAIKRFGFNFVRLHQKVNPERWYYYADALGIIVQQDMVQHYGDAFNTPSYDLYMSDLKAMIDGKYNHPSIFMWTAFNEDDMVSHFNAPAVVQWIKNYDLSRLVDTDSGGPANNLHVGDANDIHDYPNPLDPKPSNTQFAEIGEFGGLGAFVTGHQWVQGACYAYETVGSPANLAQVYIGMSKTILANKKDISVSVYTQITDVELECDGFYNMDRTDKFTAEEVQAIAAANQALINT